MFNQPTVQLIELIEAALDCCYLGYIFSAVVLVMARLYGLALGRGNTFKKTLIGRWINRIWYWTKWPALVFLILDPFFYFLVHEKTDWAFWLFEVLGFYNWYSYKDAGDDDDEFKKKFKKAAMKVVETGGKLIAVPESA